MMITVLLHARHKLCLGDETKKVGYQMSENHVLEALQDYLLLYMYLHDDKCTTWHA